MRSSKEATQKLWANASPEVPVILMVKSISETTKLASNRAVRPEGYLMVASSCSSTPPEPERSTAVADTSDGSPPPTSRRLLSPWIA